MERILESAVMRFSIDNYALSIETAGIEFLKFMTKRLDQGRCTDIVFDFDFARLLAYLFVPHNLLVSKLTGYLATCFHGFQISQQNGDRLSVRMRHHLIQRKLLVE